VCRSAGAGSREQRRSRGWWALASVERTRCGWGRSGRRSGARPGAAAVRCSRAGLEEGQTSRARKGSLCEALGLETVALDRHSLQRLDGEPVTLSQELAEAGWECEAPDGASSCQSGRHGCPHLSEHWADHRNTDLQWGWADTAAARAAGAAAGRRRLRGLQAAAAGRRRRTWAAVRRRRARRCGQGQRPASGPRRG
jgi:hypothetical protein